MKSIRIATRQSTLALWQANFVKQQLQHYYPSAKISLVPKTTKGDVMLDSPLAKIGGKGLFIKELETALLNNEADIAVHSLKDMPVTLPEGLTLACICERHNPFDALVSNRYNGLAQLPAGAIVGTSSLRRQAQILRQRPDIKVQWLRGNVNSRLRKLDDGNYDAIILASAGLERLGFEQRITELLTSKQCLPAVGQGAMAIETRVDDGFESLLADLHHPATAHRVTAERALNRALNGGCQVPIAAYATYSETESNLLEMSALVANNDGTEIIEVDGNSHFEQAEQLGKTLATELLDKGAQSILDEFGIDR